MKERVGGTHGLEQWKYAPLYKKGTKRNKKRPMETTNPMLLGVLMYNLFLLRHFLVGTKRLYSNHLNTGLVRYSNGQKVSRLQSVQYSNGI